MCGTLSHTLTLKYTWPHTQSLTLTRIRWFTVPRSLTFTQIHTRDHTHTSLIHILL